MTPEEKAYCESVRASALKLVTKLVRVQQETAKGSNARRIAEDAGLIAMDLMNNAISRMTNAATVAELQEVQAADYDLSTLASAPVSSIEE